MFNNSGELNASSVRDALATLTKYAAIQGENVPSNMNLSGQISESQRDELISRAIMTNDGKVALAQAMANPIRKNLDYQGLARRILVVDPLNLN
jgi:hypothetical protein